MKRVAVFGSTGSIGRQTLSVCEAHPNEFSVSTLVFASNHEEGVRQIRRFDPIHVGVFDERAADIVRAELPDAEIVSGNEVWKLAALDDSDIVVDGVSGFYGLHPLLCALKAGKPVALANKESVVCAGRLVREALKKGGCILPVDSEQSAIFQCLSSGRRQEVRTLILTASGGAFRSYPIEKLGSVTAEMALNHPTWSMGRKITIDSATMFNKGLEIMEAAFLFDMDAENIEVLIHPQSVVHSMVEFCDGSVIAQMSPPDMRLAIQYALTYPNRKPSPVKRLDLSEYSDLVFERPDTARFPAIELAYEAMRRSDTARLAYNSANEVAVARFINGEIAFLNIYDCVRHTIERMPDACIDDMRILSELDSQARRIAMAYCP